MLNTPRFLVLAIFGSLLIGCGKSPDQAASQKAQIAAGQPPQVGIITITKEPVTVPFELPGRVVAYATAEIRPQVDGIIQELLFKEGTQVAKGDALFKLDNQRYLAAKNAAVASVERAEASVAQLKATLKRREQLAKSKAITAEDLDEATTNVKVAEAELEVTKAELQSAELNLAYTTIRAPISGMIGRRAVDVGSLVTANQSAALATVRQLDPIFVDLVDTSVHWLRIRQQEPQASFNAQNQRSPELFISLEDGTQYPLAGRLSLADVVVSESTSTFTVRSEFPNPNILLLPGMFVRVNAQISGRDDLYLLPQRAVTRNPQGQATVLFLTQDNTVEKRTVDLGRSLDNYWLVSDGVEVGDRVIIDGVQKVRPGMKVDPVTVSINSDGVVTQDFGGEAPVEQPVDESPSESDAIETETTTTQPVAESSAAEPQSTENEGDSKP